MAMAMAGRLGAMLVSSGLINEEQLKKALAVQQKEGGRLGSILVKMNFVQEEKLMMFLSKQYGVPYVDLNRFEVDINVVKLIPSDVAQKYQIMPINRTYPLRELMAACARYLVEKGYTSKEILIFKRTR